MSPKSNNKYTLKHKHKHKHPSSQKPTISPKHSTTSSTKPKATTTTTTNDPSFLERTRLDRLDRNVFFVRWESERKKVSSVVPLTVVNTVVVVVVVVVACCCYLCRATHRFESGTRQEKAVVCVARLTKFDHNHHS